MTIPSTTDDARDALEEHISPELAGEVLDAIDEAAREMISEYELRDEVDADQVAETLQRGLATIAVEWVETGTWDEDDIGDIIADLERKPTENLEFVAGFCGFENDDMVRVSEAIQSQP